MKGLLSTALVSHISVFLNTDLQIRQAESQNLTCSPTALLCGSAGLPSSCVVSSIFSLIVWPFDLLNAVGGICGRKRT